MGVNPDRTSSRRHIEYVALQARYPAVVFGNDLHPRAHRDAHVFPSLFGAGALTYHKELVGAEPAEAKRL